MSLEFGAHQETHKCTRIKFIWLQFDEDFQEDAEMRSNHWVLLKQAALITWLLSETGLGALQAVFDVIGAHPPPVTLLICAALHLMCFPPWWPL